MLTSREDPIWKISYEQIRDQKMAQNALESGLHNAKLLSEQDPSGKTWFVETNAKYFYFASYSVDKGNDLMDQIKRYVSLQSEAFKKRDVINVYTYRLDAGQYPDGAPTCSTEEEIDDFLDKIPECVVDTAHESPTTINIKKASLFEKGCLRQCSGSDKDAPEQTRGYPSIKSPTSIFENDA